MTRMSCVASWPGARSALEMAIICSFMVFGTAAWKLMPESGDAAVAVENLVVMLTTFGFDASLAGMNAMVRPEMGEVKAESAAGWLGVRVDGAAALAGEENKSAGIESLPLPLPDAAAAAGTLPPPPNRLMMSSTWLRGAVAADAPAGGAASDEPMPKMSASKSCVVCRFCRPDVGEVTPESPSPVRSSSESLSALVLPTARFSETVQRCRARLSLKISALQASHSERTSAHHGCLQLWRRHALQHANPHVLLEAVEEHGKLDAARLRV